MGRHRIHIANIPYATDEERIRQFLAPRVVTEVVIPYDRETQRSRGYAFAELTCAEDAQSAIAELNEAELDGRFVLVAPAKERPNAGAPPRSRSAPPPRKENHRRDSRSWDRD